MSPRSQDGNLRQPSSMVLAADGPQVHNRHGRHIYTKGYEIAHDECSEKLIQQQEQAVICPPLGQYAIHLRVSYTPATTSFNYLMRLRYALTEYERFATQNDAQALLDVAECCAFGQGGHVHVGELLRGGGDEHANEVGQEQAGA